MQHRLAAVQRVVPGDAVPVQPAAEQADTRVQQNRNSTADMAGAIA